MTTDHPNMPVQPAQDVNAPHSLRGMTPETWACVGCGVNTAPGCPTRAEFEEAFDGGQESVGYNIDERFEVYTVRNAVWKAVGMEPIGGCLCIGCLEQRLGRRLKPKDFQRGHPLNGVPGTPRLLQRQKRRGQP